MIVRKKNKQNEFSILHHTANILNNYWAIFPTVARGKSCLIGITYRIIDIQSISENRY